MIETIHWHTLHPRYLGSQSRVLDLGANRGHFAHAVTERFGCHCVAVEPSPEAFKDIPETALISKLQAAVADKSGIMPFHVASESVASSLLHKAASHKSTIDVPVLSLPDLLGQLCWSRIDLLKIDIEGAEIGMLASCPDDLLRRVAQISVEFHDFCGITPRKDVTRTLARLQRLGFRSIRMSRVGHQDTLIINQEMLGVSMAEILFTRYVVRNWRGLRRMVARQLEHHQC